jgi:flagellar basal-body rod modification protein FlgD
MAGAIDSIAGSGTQVSQGKGYSAMSAEDFTKLILTELSKQDPLQPNDTNALIQQIGQIRSIQSDMDLTGALQSLVSQNEFASASTLIGKSISGLTEDSRRVEGTVKSIRRTEAGAVAELVSGERVPVASLDSILAEAQP